MKNDKLQSAAATAGLIGICTAIGASPLAIAAGCFYLGKVLLESKEDPNTISTEYTPAPHRKHSK